MRRGRGRAWLAATSVAIAASPAYGQVPMRPPPVPRPVPTVAPPSNGPLPTNLRGRVGLDLAVHLARSTDADDRLRGLERAAALGTPEGLALLERATRPLSPGAFDPRAPMEGFARQDTRALLVAVRGLAAWTERESAREALGAVLTASTQLFPTRLASGATRDPAADDAESADRLLLAREEAAIALAASGNTLSLEGLLTAARAGGSGQEPALAALALFPPSPPLLGGVALTTPAMVMLAVNDGDLRALDAIEGTLSASDPTLRATALAALGAAGDARVLGVARDAVRDKDPRVRVAAVEALARLGAPEARAALEPLVADDLTARDALRVAELVQGDGVTRAVAARAAASSDAVIRAAAVAALGHQVTPLAVGALAALAADARIAGDAADALARSPSRAAMAAIETLGAAAATRRLAARAYWVRRAVRHERSPRLDALLSTLAASRDGADRAVGVQALVALGERPVEAALADADPRVRRAAAMGATASNRPEARAALLGRLAIERDETTRALLAIGLAYGVDGETVPTLELLDRARSGGPDAPVAALALARRADDELEPKIDALLASRDPLLRAHAARGLGASPSRDAVGRLARAYAFEADVDVRRALVSAVAAREADAGTPSRRDTLALAARLDPDRLVRDTARRAIDGARAAAWPPLPSDEVTWLRIVPAEGATLPAGLTGTFTGADGLSRPIVFDDDGYALVPGVPAGQGRLRLASRVPAYEAP